jgi:hypothetical protein
MACSFLVLDPTEGVPTLQEFAKRVQQVVDIAAVLESLGWEIEADLSYEALVLAYPPYDVNNEEELFMLIESAGINLLGLGVADEYSDEEDDEEEEGDWDDEIAEFFDSGPMMKEEVAQQLVGKTITEVDTKYDTLILGFNDGSKLFIDGDEAVLEE